jgi:uncharacterized protein
MGFLLVGALAMTNLKFNVAQLLLEEIGAWRDYGFTEERLNLDDVLTLRDITGSVRFTRTASGVFAHIRARGVVRMVCVRSLEEFDQPVDLDVSDEFHSVIDVVSAETLPTPTEEDPFLLDTFHMADIGECIREYTLIELPLSPVCEAWRGAPVSYTLQSEHDADEGDEDVVDERLEVLKTWRHTAGE